MHRSRTSNGGQPDEVRQTKDHDRNSLGFPAGRKAQTSGGGRQAGVPSRWTFAPRPVEMGGEKRVKIDREAASTDEIWRAIGYRSGER